MAFVKKTWKDRIAEFPTRRRLTKSNGDSELVTVTREEGTISQEGDAFSAENMNDLERRVDDAISEINSNLNMKLLWENPNSYSTFDAQTVELSSNDYDFVDIYYRFFASESTETGKIILCKRTLKGSNSRLDYITYIGGTILDVRNVDCRTIGRITFGNANRNNETRNDILIPYKIYGCKFK